jgi:hypothetical protein
LTLARPKAPQIAGRALSASAGEQVNRPTHRASQTVLPFKPSLLLQLLDQPLSAYWRIAQKPCAINEIDILDGRICVQRMNETHHLERIA